MNNSKSTRLKGLPASAPFRYAEQMTPPDSEPVSAVAQASFQDVLEVNPKLMQRHVMQQIFPNWQTLRLMRSRHDHLDWMHHHFASAVVHGSEILAELED